jgi:hypothetical protein
MKEKKLKVNVTFPLEVPVLTDSAGRRRSIPDQVAGYIDDFMSDVRISMECGRTNYGLSLSKGPSESDRVIYDKISSEKIALRIAESEKLSRENHIKFEKSKDKECRELYDMSWNEFRVLNWKEQTAIKEINGVYWREGKWVKK